MGMMVEGKWVDDDAKYRIDARGAFVRPDSRFRSVVTRDGSSGFRAEPGRYHLFVAHNCPWAHRALIARALKRLEDVVSLTSADLPRRQSWTYSVGLDDMKPTDGAFQLHQLYAAAAPDYTGRVTVPTLWDRQRRTIVNNESSEIIRMLDTEFAQWADNGIDLYPEPLRPQIDEINAYVYQHVNNGVYRCGFARSQQAYEEAFARVFEALDTLEARLSKQRYLVGNTFTEADLRLYPTLVRFDAVYHYLFKCNLRRLEDYPNLSNYVRDLYSRPAFRDTTDIDRIKRGYYANQAVNPAGIVPLGPVLDFSRAHDRDRFPRE
ncbi:MAG: glutathione S-transferase family protein [Burkholderiales bacterium]|nr:glutathione S-transferase family protein [Burkholderiales bacterium]